jgi:hypothetical protein
MTYLTFEIEFENPEIFARPENPYRSFAFHPENDSQSSLLGYNFNRYYALSQAIDKPRIDMRLNLDNPQESIRSIHECSDHLVKAKKIERYSPDTKP